MWHGPRSIGITLRPQHEDGDFTDPNKRPCTLLVLFGPQDGDAKESRWMFEFNLISSSSKAAATIVKERAVLWYNGRPSELYKLALVEPKCRFAPELEPVSIVLRGANLSYVPRDRFSSLVVRPGQIYRLNLLFLDGQTLNHYVYQLGWRFSLFLLTKQENLQSGMDEVIGTRLFTQFETAFLNGNEHAPADQEIGTKQQTTAILSQLPPQVVKDHFTPLLPMPPQPSAPLMANQPPILVRQQSQRPVKAMKDMSWDLVLSKKGDHEPFPAADLESVKSLALPFTMDVLFTEFATWGPLPAALNAVDRLGRLHAGDPASPIRDQCKVIINTFSAVAQLPGWQHVQDYITDPTGYTERVYAAAAPATSTTTVTFASLVREDRIWPLQAQGKLLLTQFVLRVNWLLHLSTSSSSNVQDHDYLAMLYYLCNDSVWLADARQFMKEAEVRVTQILTRNATSFAKFRDLQKRGVGWPHSATVRRDIEIAGWTFRPCMIKRDRIVCDTCLVEVSGLRPWHDPWRLHDYGRHPPTFRAPHLLV